MLTRLPAMPKRFGHSAIAPESETRFLSGNGFAQMRSDQEQSEQIPRLIPRAKDSTGKEVGTGLISRRWGRIGAALLGLAILGTTACGTNGSSGALNAQADSQAEAGRDSPELGEGETILAELEIDLTGDGNPESLYVIGETAENPFEQRKRLLILGEAHAWAYPLEGDTMSLPLAGQPFIIQKVPDGSEAVFGILTDPRGNGGKGTQFVHLFRVGDKGLTMVAVERTADPAEHYRVEFVGDRRFLVENLETGMAWDLEVPWEGAYPPEGYEAEDLEPAFYPEHSFAFEDIDADGTDELIGRQILTGVAHVDIIADLGTIYEWNGTSFRESGNFMEQGLHGETVTIAPIIP